MADFEMLDRGHNKAVCTGAAAPLTVKLTWCLLLP